MVPAAEDADSRHTILHETGHWLQFKLPDTASRARRTVRTISSTRPAPKGCAWTEGFGDVVAARTLGDYRYV
ncbi:hypothetical protein F4556_006928 [Kitasatospora gansuensis]|uniref:Uncharacterized protein n=1 Tax=Kitasatospora gansuensis TaxID=258050 RepID=A0A7W7SJ29_9ACTN|nr:hypothetical protein [Kitasatospora gansuensis]